MVADGLNVFVDSISKYFNVTSQHSALVGTPFLTKDASNYISDYTGVIEILGDYHGSIFFTAPERMLMRLLRELGLVSTQENKLLDLAGEISNILSGSARHKFGENFKIMPPIAYHGENNDAPQSTTKTIFVIPIEWKGLTANLIINLEANSDQLVA